MYNNKELEDKVRALIIPALHMGLIAKTYLENKGWQDSDGYRNTINSLNTLKELKGIIGLKEDEIKPGTNTKNLKLFNQ